MQVKAGALAGRQGVPQRDSEAFPLSHAQGQRLNRVALQPGGHPGISVTSPCRRIADLFLLHSREVVLEDIHPALRIVIEVLVEGDVHGGGDDLVAPRRGVPRAGLASFRRIRASAGDQLETLAVLVSALVVVGPAVLVSALVVVGPVDDC